MTRATDSWMVSRGGPPRWYRASDRRPWQEWLISRKHGTLGQHGDLWRFDLGDIEAKVSGLELGFQILLFRLEGADAPAVFVQNGINDLLGQRLIAYLEVLQEFTFHG